MFDFIKNFFGGIFSFFGKLFGFNKSEYVLEFDSGSGTVPAAKGQPAEPAKTQPAKPAAPEAKAKAEPAPAKPAQSAAPAKESKPQPPKAAEPAGGFATSYLVSTSTSTRRRPGANMNSFLNMATQVKTAR
ncbi:hypothetical protein [Kamptonema formosum]|uniref:hypothetical protein n=1 Tax=Kamptonema formosum TaxID=331992 RepID=UPI0003483A7D|nr:hypothetical protein [Oscillatoria sp. PCC 10802]